MDEPTAVLDRGEVDTLFRSIRELVADGVAIVYISRARRSVRARTRAGADGIGILLVSSEIREVLGLADRVLVAKGVSSTKRRRPNSTKRACSI
jgi:ABC-type sugar transport system ATPase subunit